MVPIRPAVVGAFALTLVLGIAGLAHLAGGQREAPTPPALTSQLPPLTIPSDIQVAPTSIGPRPSASTPPGAAAVRSPSSATPPSGASSGGAGAGPAGGGPEARASTGSGAEQQRSTPPTTSTSPAPRRPMTEQEMRDALCASYDQPRERCADPDDD